MKRVISFNIAQRKRDALLAFLKAVITASQRDEKVTAECSIQLAALVAAYNKMQTLAERHQMNLLTPEVRSADEWRDANFTRFRAAVRSQLKNPDPAIRQAAELLWKICEEMGRIHNLPYDQQTGAMTTFCLDLQNNHQQEVKLLGLTDSLNLLNASNDDFIKVLAERTNVDGSYVKGSPQQARAEAEAAYRNFVMKLNTLLSEGHYDELAPFVNYLNAEIERQRIALRQGVASTTTGPEDMPEDVPEQTPEETPEETPETPEGTPETPNTPPEEKPETPNTPPEENENQQPGGGDQTGGGTTNTPSGPNTDAWGDGDEGDGSDV